MCNKDECYWCKKNCLINEMEYYDKKIKELMNDVRPYGEMLDCTKENYLKYERKYIKAKVALDEMDE